VKLPPFESYVLHVFSRRSIAGGSLCFSFIAILESQKKKNRQQSKDKTGRHEGQVG
jgi:hypothetical protein|tara:strand:- start:36 stop:203 length:168 start_codon:yes stop_codon:yes gene_type:complete